MNKFYLVESYGYLRGKFWREKILTTTPEKYIPCSNQDVVEIEKISVIICRGFPKRNLL
jgi:hypothetical protein